ITDSPKSTAISLPSCSGSVGFSNLRAEDLSVSKTASPAFVRTFAWGTTKAVDQTSAKISGGQATFNYTVSVTHDTGTDSDWQVTGAITVTNPNSCTVAGVNVTDTIGDPN